ncbi:unnamed protein product [Linum tenue]|uniref:TIR domain-containing protein n=1 Tax=Linum tenue TaxID=586396 RepID=A0AAV0JYG3_9ROSI|nr:unnamed protein product [Linum tenue]
MLQTCSCSILREAFVSAPSIQNTQLPGLSLQMNISETFFVKSSSSASSSRYEPPLPTGEYEVFLSFRGPDVRTTFADCLYSVLARSKIRTFRDEEELRKGEQIAPSLVQAIIQSKIHIPIFSQNYASSKWCLQELAKMVECWKQGKGHLILPIFYFVNPRDVRHQDGPFKEAFELHDQKHDAATVMEWREALQEVGKMKGWTVHKSDGQGAIIDAVFSRVDSYLMRSYKLGANQDLVGIDFHVEQVVRLLNLDSSQGVKIVSIHGIGGVGKTTLAKAVYDEIYPHFDRCCFLEDVREALTKNGKGLVSLQNKVISSILGHNDDLVEDADEGIHVIKDRVCRHKVFLVLDDVDEMFEFVKTLGKLEDFSAGCRILITTRDIVLNLHQEYKLYELGEMSPDYSLQLFSKHAFGMDYPAEDYAALSDKFVQAAGGLPLALKVIGALLFRKGQKVWEEKLLQLEEVPPSKIQERLKISYDALTYEEQQIFLDIACFFIGEDKVLPIYMWSDCRFYPESGIETLVLRSLIKFNNEHEFWMHDHIRDLGRAIVRQENIEYPDKRSRIWSNDCALDMLSNKEGTNNVIALKFRTQSCDIMGEEEFRKLSRLRFLEAGHANLTGNFKGILPNVRWLRLSWCDLIPTSFGMNKLVTIELDNVGISDDWAGWAEMKPLPELPTSLNRLIISSPVPNLSDLKNLEELQFEHCEVELGIPGDIWKLCKLKTLILTKCPCESLLVEEGSLPSSLNCLRVQQCDPVARLPNLANLNRLTELRLSSVKVGEIHGLGELTLLTTLEISFAPNLTTLDGLENLVLLTALTVRDCCAITRLPSLATLTNLCSLEVLECELLTEIQGLDQLGQCLLHLEIHGCNLANLEGLQSTVALQRLVLVGCESIHTLPPLSKLKKLKTIFFNYNDKLSRTEGLGQLISLQKLELWNCKSLKQLPDLSHLHNLNVLSISGCEQLIELSGLDGLASLAELSIDDCRSITKLGDLSGLRNLKDLQILRCPQLTEVTGLEGLVSLQGLSITGCTSITKLSPLSSLKKLKGLHIERCTQLSEITGLEGLESLEELWLHNCPSIKELSGLSRLINNLETLDIEGCTQLPPVIGPRGVNR